MMSSRVKALLPVVGLGLVLIATDALMAQPGAGRSLRFGGNKMVLLRSQRVQRELELSEDQVGRLTVIQEELASSMRRIFADSAEGRDDRDKVQAAIDKASLEAETSAAKVLSAEQALRLQELSFQAYGLNRPVGAVLKNEEFLSALKVSESKAKELHDLIDAARQKLQERIAELTRESEAEILGLLTAEQREKYKVLLGAEFDFDTRRGGRGGRGRGGDGGH